MTILENTSQSYCRCRQTLTFQCLNLKSMTNAEKEQLHQKLYTKSEDNIMMYKFQDLFSSTTDSLQQKKIPAKELARQLQCLRQLKPTEKNSEEPVFGCRVQKIKKMESLCQWSTITAHFLISVCWNTSSKNLEQSMTKIT